MEREREVQTPLLLFPCILPHSSRPVSEKDAIRVHKSLIILVARRDGDGRDGGKEGQGREEQGEVRRGREGQ
ncbi:hypothetical protein E2C01_067850 [Portunus trituberculatus]|uniref:Uncharacterized protein n=1 Tax=Portunus trituberculatus TaxID=210409 RepID=A0A5B7HXW8_PORTR|nr:hypothetical protein [Portunus trituberculatus]